MSSVPNTAPDLSQPRRIALIAGAAGLLVCVLAALVSGDWRVQFFRSYLWAFNYCLGIPLGCLVVLMIQHLTGGIWGYAMRRTAEAATRTFPVLLVLFLPIALGLSSIFLWADPVLRAADEDLAHKAEWYLRPDLALLRVPVYFGVWIGLAFIFNSWSRTEERANTPALQHRFRAFSAAGLALYGLTMTFASIDWMMSLEPKWWSTIYGPMVGIGQVLSGFAFTLVILLLLRPTTALNSVLTPIALRDCGNLMMAFTMVWAYLSFSQFLLIWSGNLPEEITWYLVRIEGGWLYVALILVTFHFTVPFALLLSKNVKQDPDRLFRVALMIVCVHAIDVFWLIMPAFGSHGYVPEGEKRGFSCHPLDLAALVGIGGIWLATFLWQLGRGPLVPAFAYPEEEDGHGG